MQLYLWDSYSDGKVTDKIKYWVDLWEDLIENFNEKSYGLKLLNPHLLLNDIVDEIDSNDFGNKDNRKYFYDQLNYFQKNDPAIKRYFKTDFELTRRIFNSGRNIYLRQLCKNVYDIFQTGNYFRKSFQILQDIILDPQHKETDESNINFISQSLIVELLLKGYSLKTMQKFPHNIFSSYSMHENFLETDYPHSIRWKDSDTGNHDEDIKAYSSAIHKEMNDLTIQQRLQKFIYYYEKTPEVFWFIFSVEGLKGMKEFVVGDVLFYSPFQKRIVKKQEGQHDPELFHGTESGHFLNAAIKVKTIDFEASKQEAIDSIEKALDLIRCYVNIEPNFTIATNSYIRCDNEGNLRGESFSRSDDKWFKFHKSFDSETLEEDSGLSTLFKDAGSLFKSIERSNEIEQKIRTSLHWYRKAEETDILEDKILNYWVVVENLFTFKNIGHNLIFPGNQKETKFLLIKELLPPLLISNFIFDNGWQTFHYLRHLLNSSQGDRKYLSLPKHVIDACNLDPVPGAVIKLQLFVDNLDLLIAHVDRKIIKDKILYTNKFYKDNVLAKKEIEVKLMEIKNNILLFFRYRNKIVHNAHFDNTILPYYVKVARNFAGELLRHILFKFNSNDSITVEDILLNSYTRLNRLMEKLNSSVSVDFLHLEI